MIKAENCKSDVLIAPYARRKLFLPFQKTEFGVCHSTDKILLSLCLAVHEKLECGFHTIKSTLTTQYKSCTVAFSSLAPPLSPSLFPSPVNAISPSLIIDLSHFGLPLTSPTKAVGTSFELVWLKPVRPYRYARALPTRDEYFGCFYYFYKLSQYFKICQFTFGDLF